MSEGQSEATPLSRDDGVSFWNHLWEQGRIKGFHESDLNILLLQHIDELIAGRQNIRVFIPLCGKALEIKWFADLGHTVVGVDSSPLAVEAFFTENSLEFTKQPVEKVNGTLYQCTSLPISIYCCDFMLFCRDVEGPFDAIWDRGGLVAVRKSDLSAYCQVIKSLMGPGCRYFVETMEYDPNMFGGPPSFISEEMILTLFGDLCTCQKLATIEDKVKHNRWAPASEFFYLCLWLLVPK
jgi:thiopurine S-methyltransferase